LSGGTRVQPASAIILSGNEKRGAMSKSKDYKLSKVSKLKGKLFLTRSLPILVISLIVGLGGLQVISSVFATNRFRGLIVYAWLAVFIIAFVAANRIFVTNYYKRKMGIKSTGKNK